MNSPQTYVLLRGGGDLGSGVALRLVRCGIPVVITELPQPLSVRRKVSFSEAIWDGEIVIEGVRGFRTDIHQDIISSALQGDLPVLVDPTGTLLKRIPPQVIVDARMCKFRAEKLSGEIPLVIGLGPGFTAGENCDAVIETNRGPNLGRVFWQGPAEEDTGLPERVWQYRAERVLRAPASGEFEALHEIGDRVTGGTPVARVTGVDIPAPFDGVIRGLLRNGMRVEKGVKVGDLDPRNDPGLCTRVSDKSLSIGGGVLEAILSRPKIRRCLYSYTVHTR